MKLTVDAARRVWQERSRLEILADVVQATKLTEEDADGALDSDGPATSLTSITTSKGKGLGGTCGSLD
jgi:hypothetical protein